MYQIEKANVLSLIYIVDPFPNSLSFLSQVNFNMVSKARFAGCYGLLNPSQSIHLMSQLIHPLGCIKGSSGYMAKHMIKWLRSKTHFILATSCKTRHICQANVQKILKNCTILMFEKPTITW